MDTFRVLERQFNVNVSKKKMKTNNANRTIHDQNKLLKCEGPTINPGTKKSLIGFPVRAHVYADCGLDPQ